MTARNRKASEMREFKDAFVGTNFGTNNYDELILTALENVATGYSNGSTISGIIEDLNLVEYREGGTVVVLSAYGLDKMYQLKGIAS